MFKFKEVINNSTLFLRTIRFLIALSLIIAVGLFGYAQFTKAKYAGLAEDQGIITVTGKATIKTKATYGQLHISLQHTASTSAEAKNFVANQAQQVMQILLSNHVNKKDIDTSSFSINPNYEWNNGHRTLKGYTANQVLTIKTNNIDIAQTIISKLADAGITNIHYSSTIEPQLLKTLKEQARYQAIQDAKKKARTLAKALGVHLGKLVSYNDGGDYDFQPAPMYKASVSSDTEHTTPILPSGEKEQTVQVTLQYKVW